MPENRRSLSGDEMEEAEPSRKRRRAEISEIESRLENLILRVGEKSTSSIESNLEGLSGVLEADLSTYKRRILEILSKCVVELPEKATIYSTLVGLLNAKNYNFGGEFIEILLKRLRNCLSNNSYDNALHLIVFVSDLVNSRVVSAHSCLSFLEGMLEAAFQPGGAQLRADWFVGATLQALVCAGRELFERKPADLDQLLAAVERYVGRRQKLHVPLLRVWPDGDGQPHAQLDALDSLWQQLSSMRADGWTERHLRRHYIAFDAVLCDALQHNLPALSPAAPAAAASPLPRVTFRLFDQSDCADDGVALPSAVSVERFLVERDIAAILKQYHKNRKECATALLQHYKAGSIPLNYVILEVIFGQLFRLPKPPYLELFYGSLLIELCKLQPNSMPQVLAQAAEMLYQRVDLMHVACFDRFVDWFSYHLSNFQLRWSWEEWTDCLKLDKLAPKRVFINEVLHKCMRFSYHQRVVDNLPADFAPLLPVKPQAHFKYGLDGSQSLPGTATAHQLAQAIRAKCTAEEVLTLLNECPREADAVGVTCNPLAIDVFVLTLLHLGSKTFSHSFAALTKYHSALKSLTENNEDAQLCVLKAVNELWHTHPQMQCVLVDKLLKMQIVECSVVAQWIFSEDLKEDFLHMWVWEILQSSLVKLSRHVQKLRLDLEAAVESDSKEAYQPEAMDEGGEDGAEPAAKHAEMAERLRGAENVQKTFILTVFQKLTILLAEHLLQSEAEGVDFNTPWYRWVSGRMRHMFISQHLETLNEVDNLSNFLFTNDIDPHILEIFHQFCALRR